jgi:hypothetical protein
MKTHQRWAIALVAAASLCAVPAGSVVTYTMRGNVLGNGGNPGANASFALQGTAGQAAVGQSTNASFQLCHGFWCFGGSRVLATPPDGGPAVPKELSFGLPTPNPSRGDTHFLLALPQAADVTLTVYDVTGRMLGEPATQHLAAGYQQLYWRAPAEHSGVYFARLQVDGAIKGERRIVLIR